MGSAGVLLHQERGVCLLWESCHSCMPWQGCHGQTADYILAGHISNPVLQQTKVNVSQI